MGGTPPKMAKKAQKWGFWGGPGGGGGGAQKWGGPGRGSKKAKKGNEIIENPSNIACVGAQRLHFGEKVPCGAPFFAFC